MEGNCIVNVVTCVNHSAITSILRYFATLGAAHRYQWRFEMRAPYLTSLIALAFVLAACSGQQVSAPKMPEKGNPEYFKVRDSMADEVYVNEDVAKTDWVDRVRRIYLAPTNTSRTQIIQPRGVSASDIDAWEMTAEEESVLQNKFFQAMPPTYCRAGFNPPTRVFRTQII